MTQNKLPRQLLDAILKAWAEFWILASFWDPFWMNSCEHFGTMGPFLGAGSYLVPNLAPFWVNSETHFRPFGPFWVNLELILSQFGTVLGTNCLKSGPQDKLFEKRSLGQAA